jgi:4-azaleucine resistance transporter AzlC
MEDGKDRRRNEFRDGFISMMPLWLGAVPFAIAYAILARSSGFTQLETNSMSALVFAGAAMLSLVDLSQEHASSLAILATVLLLNLRHVLYAMTLDLKLAKPRAIPKPILAAGLTDEGMGLTLAQSQGKPTTDWFFMGTVVSLYCAFCGATILGVILGGSIPDPERLHLDIVFPLAFLALLLPLVKSRRSLVIAISAASLSVALRPILGASNAVLIAILAGGAVGTLMTTTSDRDVSIPTEDLQA